MIHDQGATGWHKSSYSAQNGNCVEQGVSASGELAKVRDTKDSGIGPVLDFHPTAWAKFVESVR
jgi:hypothetical protein